MKQYGFGVDIGGTTCKIGLFDMNGTIFGKVGNQNKYRESRSSNFR